jgi:hypothetical protein
MFLQGVNSDLKTASLSTYIKIYILMLLGCTLTCLPARSQDINFSSHAALAEKVYLQLDNNVYAMDQTIWFKAIVAGAGDHAPMGLSRVLHVELIDQNERVAEKKLIKLEQGIGNGFFQLNQNLTEGHYLVRAYTEWNKNFGSAFFFNEYIRVMSTSNKTRGNPIKDVTLVEGGNERRLNAKFDPFAIDSLHAKELTLIVSLDERSDTLSIKKNGANNYLLDYVVPANCRFITLQMQTKNQLRYSKAIVLEKDYLDLQFFPESGELVQGLSSLLGFKAIGSNGKGKVVQGDIVNVKGEVITTFTSNQLGMGSFMLDNIDSSEKYMARIISQLGDRLQKLYPLPAIAPKGNILSVKKDKDRINLQVSSNYLVNDSVFIRTSCRGLIYFDAKGRLREGSLSFSLQAHTLPEGVIDFTLMDVSMIPVAERLYFNRRPETRISIKISADKETYIQREQTKLAIETTDANGKPLTTSLSLLVFDKSQQTQLPDARQNILSHFLLNSDLKGEIESPGFYFNKNENRHDDLDALLLTQGWRKYKYSREPVRLSFKPEVALTVSGNVKGGLFNRSEKKGTGLIMMTFGQNHTIQTQNADSMGKFNFIIDEYGQDVNIIIQSANKSGTKKNYSITLDKKESPPISFNHIKSTEEPDSIVQAYVKRNIERRRLENEFASSTDGVTLGEVVVKSYFMSPERKLVSDRFGKPKTVIDGDAIREKEAKWSYGLYSVLLFNFPDKVSITRMVNGVLYARIHNSEPTLVVIDGIPVKNYDYSLIPGIPPSEVKSFELIEYAKDFRNLFCEVVSEGCGPNAPMVGNVIAIYTYGGKGLFGANPAVGIMKTAVPVFAAPREFYAPKYELLKADDWLKPDLRTLIHWMPEVKMDSLGKGSAFFYNADNTGTMQVIVEAISPNGEIGYKELFFDVKRREQNK